MVIILTLAACAPSPAAAPTAVPVEPDGELSGLTILAFGDSLTAGFGVGPEENYPAMLQAKLKGDGYAVEIINAGISGETTTSALARVEWMLNTAPDLVIVETGGNDALRGVDLAVTRANIDQIVQQFTESGAVVIVAGIQIIQNLGEPYTSGFAAIYPEVADRYDAILIPFMLEGVAADPDLNQPDFIHPNPAGYKVIVEHIYPFVLEGIQQAGEN